MRKYWQQGGDQKEAREKRKKGRTWSPLEKTSRRIFFSVALLLPW